MSPSVGNSLRAQGTVAKSTLGASRRERSRWPEDRRGRDTALAVTTQSQEPKPSRARLPAATPDDAREQLAAVSEVLRAMAGSADLGRVSSMIVSAAARLCGATDARLFRREGDDWVYAAAYGPSALGMELGAHVAPTGGTVWGRAALQGTISNIADTMTADPPLPNPEVRRTRMAVPVLRAGEPIAVLVATRDEPGGFSEREQQLLVTFADQAAMAIEHARLYNETNAALERQTAMSEVLDAINSSAFDLQPVLVTVIERAMYLCGADSGSIVRVEGGVANVIASAGNPSDTATFAAALGGRPVEQDRTTMTGRVVLAGRSVQIEDTLSDPEYDEASKAVARKTGGRTLLGVPLMRAGAVTGLFILRRKRVALFSPAEVSLVEAFAAQAVIAMENARLFNETKEALEQQSALTDVLGVISRSPFDIQPVLDSVVRNAVRLSLADNGSVVRIENGRGSIVASVGLDDEALGVLVEFYRVRPLVPGRTSLTGRVLMEGRSVQIPDALADPEYERPAGVRNPRAALGVPLLRPDGIIGVIVVRRLSPGAFSPRQVKLVEAFADQAAIAIENVRLFNETEEALERQTATSEILKVIAASPSDIAPVLDAIAESAARFCAAENVSVVLVEDGLLHPRATVGTLKFWGVPPYPIDRTTVSGRSIVERRTIQVADLQAGDDEYPLGHAQALAMGHRTTLATPLIHDGRGIGALLLRRSEVRPFSDKQVELVRIFADQAVIAIENVRLFDETKEALDRQTAISEILRIISASPTDVRPVLQAIAENAMRFCAAEDAAVMLPNEDHLQLAAHRGPVPVANDLRYPNDGTSVSSRSFLTAKTIAVQDLQTAIDYPLGAENARSGGYHAIVAAPLLRDGAALGALVLRRSDARPFSDREIGALETFAAQAVIAIENVRLFNETKESLDQQRAISDVLSAISTAGSDLQPVFDTVVRHAVALCAAEYAVLWRLDGADGVVEARVGVHRSVPELGSRQAVARLLPARRIVAGADVVHIPDLTSDPEASQFPNTAFPTRLGVAIRIDGALYGWMNLVRSTVHPFSDREVELVRTFARQAAIAVQNARLLSDTREALERQTATSEVLKAISGTAFDLARVLDTVIAHATRLTEAENGFVYQVEGDVLAMRASFGARADVMREWQREHPIKTDHTGSATGRAFAKRRTIHIPDVDADPTYTYADAKRLGGFRVLLAVPLISNALPIGVIALWRIDPRPFSPEQITLVETFADQAAIAIENARLFSEIQEKSRQLEVADRHKTEFLANMSHELRTPLNAIIGFSEVLLQKMFGELNEQQADYLRDILTSGQLLLSLINDILDLSKIEAGRMELELAPFSLPAAVSNAVTLMRERASGHRIRLAVETADDVDDVVADERKVKQVLVNLLSNAVKFTPDGGTVTVTTSRGEDEIRVAVHDTGIGIDPEDQARIFEEFQQSRRQTDQSREGTGLGLTLSRRFVELHGGRLTVESRPGRGSTFTFTLPAPGGR